MVKIKIGKNNYSAKMLSPKKMEKIQDEIYQKMSVKKKLEITGQLILLAKKLRQSKPILKKKFKK